MLPTNEEVQEASKLGLEFVLALGNRKPVDLIAEWTGEKHEIVAGVYATIIISVDDTYKAALFAILLGIWLGQRKHDKTV